MKLTKSLIAKSVAAVALIAGAAVPAFAQSTSGLSAMPFKINPAGIGVSGSTFTADQIAGTSTELLHTTDTGHYGSGWLSLGSFSLDGASVSQTGITNSYNLYVTFSLTDTYIAGTGTGINTPNSSNQLQTLTFSFYADTKFDDTYVKASSAGTGTEATVTDNGNNDILLATGSLYEGVATFNSLLGAGLNSTQSFTLTDAGAAFFVDPNPFYSMAFDEFNNTSLGASVNGNLVAITQASGSIDFTGAAAVPEPASLSLLGLGMLGLAVAKRRRAK